MPAHEEGMYAAVMAARLITQHDIPALLQAISTAETVGPFLDPTLYRDNVKAMLEDKEVLTAALPLWHMAQKLGGKLDAEPSTPAKAG